MNSELLIVVPVFNEEASIRKVVTEWFNEVQNWTEQFVFLVIDDGSRDGTPRLLRALREKFGPRFEILTQKNMGHGQSCIQGYRIACERGIPFVFQIDSDGQCDPQYFFKFWNQRDKYDVIYGHRARRQDGIKRIISSHILRLTLLIFSGVWCVDANTPYRLMNTANLPSALDRISSALYLANIGLSIVLKKMPGWRHGSIRITFRERYGGEPSVRFSQFGKKAIELITQLNSPSMRLGASWLQIFNGNRRTNS